MIKGPPHSVFFCSDEHDILSEITSLHNQAPLFRTLLVFVWKFAELLYSCSTHFHAISKKRFVEILLCNFIDILIALMSLLWGSDMILMSGIYCRRLVLCRGLFVVRI
jgi:hypothetical protein